MKLAQKLSLKIVIVSCDDCYSYTWCAFQLIYRIWSSVFAFYVASLGHSHSPLLLLFSSFGMWDFSSLLQLWKYRDNCICRRCTWFIIWLYFRSDMDFICPSALVPIAHEFCNSDFRPISYNSTLSLWIILYVYRFCSDCLIQNYSLLGFCLGNFFHTIILH